jgi:hypothetical protein
MMPEPRVCHCAEGWICEEHPDRPHPHDDCAGPGDPCDNPNCPWWRGPSPAALRCDHSFVKPDKGPH